MAMLDIKYTVKTSSIGDTKVYLGANFGKVSYGDGSYAWTMSSDSYVKKVIKNVNKRLKEDGLEYNKNISDVNSYPKNPFHQYNIGQNLTHPWSVTNIRCHYTRTSTDR